MSTTLRDQLLGLGFKSVPKPERKPDPKARDRHGPKPHPGAGHRPRQDKPDQLKARQPNPGQAKHAAAQRKPAPSREDIDLAKAYAIRAQREKDERIQTERVKQEDARLRREAKAKLAELMKGKGLNAADAEHVRHFEYGGKIKRIHVTAEQLKSLNAGELGVVQMDGRYLLVDAAMLELAEATFAPAVALKVDPKAATGDDPYADPQYQVPDDLVW